MTDTYRTTPGPLKPGECAHAHNGRMRQADGDYYYEVRASGGWKVESGHPGTYVIPEPEPEEPQDDADIEPVMTEPIEYPLGAATKKAVMTRAMKLAQTMSEKPGQKHINLAVRQLIHDEELLTATVTFRLRRKA